MEAHSQNSLSVQDETQTDGAPPFSDQRLQLSIVVPTFREKENIGELVSRLEKVLKDYRWEVVFVDDDSPDGTADTVRSFGVVRPNVRCLQRLGRRGLSSACIEGFLASSADILAVMDADLQHDESILPEMLEIMLRGETDIVVATRYGEGGSVGTWNKSRAFMSRLATRLSTLVCKRDVSDPMSGFFMLHRNVVHQTVHNLSGMGFKILMDVLASAPRNLNVREVPYTFRDRLAGESKLDSMVLWEYGLLLADKLVGNYIPVRFVAFGFVGGLGVLVHLSILTALWKTGTLPFATAQATATIGAMTSNFILNNVLTYRDRRLRGWGWIRGLAIFYAVSSIGAVANVGIAGYLYGIETDWVASALAGIAVGTVWNYAASNAFAWRASTRG